MPPPPPADDPVARAAAACADHFRALPDARARAALSTLARPLLQAAPPRAALDRAVRDYLQRFPDLAARVGRLPPAQWSLNMPQLAVCPACHHTQFRLCDEDGALVCSRCACVQYQLTDARAAHGSGYGNGVLGGGSGMSSDCFRDGDASSSSNYQRLERFLQLLTPFRERDLRRLAAEIPPDDLAAIRERVRRDRLQVPDGLDEAVLQRILKQLGRSCHLQKINILLRLFHKPLPPMLNETYYTFLRLFTIVEKTWLSMDFDEDRSNFIQYAYLFYQFCLLTRQPQFLPYIYIINDPQKLERLERLWKQSARELDWQFISVCNLRG